MSRNLFILIFSLTLICCNTNIKNDFDSKSINIDSVPNPKRESIKKQNEITPDFINKQINTLPIHGELSREELTKYYPKITDSIKELRICGSEKIDLNPGNGIIVSLLHNTGTFDQMIICTHNKKLDLIDDLYIGKATDFDNGKSHTIEYSLKSNNEVIFHQIDWGYLGEEIVPVKEEKLNISINENGQIIYKKTMPNNG